MSACLRRYGAKWGNQSRILQPSPARAQSIATSCLRASRPSSSRCSRSTRGQDLRDWQNLPRPARVIGVNVAGEATRVRVEAQLVRWRTTPEWLIAGEAAGGVYNRYARPSQLGADRWAALIAARRRVADELFPSS